jgi:hypothetical protein
VAPLPAEVPEVDASEAVSLRVDLDDPRGGACLHPIEEQVRQQERGEVVDAEHGFKPGAREGERGGVHARIVDEHIDARADFEQDTRGGAHCLQVAEVGSDDLDAHPVARAHLGADRLRLRAIAADHDDVGAAAGEAPDRLETDPRGGARHDADPAPHRGIS